MLSDSLRAMRDALRTGIRQEDTAGLMLTLQAYELEARNMEERLQLLTGRQHEPLDGMLMSSPRPLVEIGGYHVG